MTGKREMKTNGKTMGKVLAQSVACGAATTGATIFGANLIGTGLTNVVSGIKEKRAGSVVKGIFAIGVGGIVFAGTHIINSIVTDKIVDDLIEVEQSITEEGAISETEEDLKSDSSIDWNRLNMAGRKVHVVEPAAE